MSSNQSSQGTPQQVCIMYMMCYTSLKFWTEMLSNLLWFLAFCLEFSFLLLPSFSDSSLLPNNYIIIFKQRVIREKKKELTSFYLIFLKIWRNPIIHPEQAKSIISSRLSWRVASWHLCGSCFCINQHLVKPCLSLWLCARVLSLPPTDWSKTFLLALTDLLISLNACTLPFYCPNYILYNSRYVIFLPAELESMFSLYYTSGNKNIFSRTLISYVTWTRVFMLDSGLCPSVEYV